MSSISHRYLFKRPTVTFMLTHRYRYLRVLAVNEVDVRDRHYLTVRSLLLDIFDSTGGRRFPFKRALGRL